MAREFEVLESESTALDDQAKAFEAQVAKAPPFPKAGRVFELCAKGLKKLSRNEESEFLNLVKELKAHNQPLEDKFAELKRRFAAHKQRHDAAIKSPRQRQDFEQRESDRQRVKVVEEIGGLLAYGMACRGLTGNDWSFAKSVCDDFQAAPDATERKRQFGLLAQTLRVCKVAPATEALESSAILSQFEHLQGEDASAFYRRNKNEIIKAVDQARQTPESKD